jgi:hypothetical protein
MKMSIGGGLLTSFTTYLTLDVLIIFVEGSFWMHCRRMPKEHRRVPNSDPSTRRVYVCFLVWKYRYVQVEVITF